MNINDGELSRLLLSDNEIKRASGRLIATDFHSDFQDWCQAEKERGTKPIVLMQATAQTLVAFLVMTYQQCLKPDAPADLIEDLGELLRKEFKNQWKMSEDFIREKKKENENVR